MYPSFFIRQGAGNGRKFRVQTRRGYGGQKIPSTGFPARLYGLRSLRANLSCKGKGACHDSVGRITHPRGRKLGVCAKPADHANEFQAEYRQGKSVFPALIRVFLRLLGMRGNALYQGADAAIRRADGDCQRNGLFFHLRGFIAYLPLCFEQKRARPCLGKFSFYVMCIN